MRSCFFILLFIPSIAFSQYIGVKGGVNCTYFNFHKGLFPEPTSAITSTFGIIYTQPIKKFQLLIEPTYNAKGYTQNILTVEGMTAMDGTSTYEFKHRDFVRLYSFIEIPISFGWTPVNHNFMLGVNTGFAPSYLLEDKSYTILPKGIHFHDISFKNIRKLNVDYIATINAGFKIRKCLLIALNVRYGTNIWTLYKTRHKPGYQYISSFLSLSYRIGRNK